VNGAIDTWVKRAVENGVATVTIDHPPLNVLTRAVGEGLRGALEALAPLPDLRAVVLGATGKHFSVGADVGEHLPPVYREMIPEFVRTIEAVMSFPVPVIAAVRGRCLGGGFELAQAADLIVAGEGASFGQPEIQLAVTAPVASVLLPRLLPRGVAAEILYTGDTIGAARAREIGLVARVVPDDEVDGEARALAQRIARWSAPALRLAKRTVRAADGLGPFAGFRVAEKIYVGELMETRDALEGLNAFLEKRGPSWSHR
jgi:cyclohexa-1,5-dienecarbonyl-CoA hydratase